MDFSSASNLAKENDLILFTHQFAFVELVQAAPKWIERLDIATFVAAKV